MRKTSFGEMIEIKIPGDLLSDCEVMHFEKSGRFHSHSDKDEFAIVISGSGYIHIENEIFPVNQGDSIRIEAGLDHYMTPDNKETLCMFIGYLNPQG